MQTYSCELARSLNKLGHDLTVICCYSPGCEDFDADESYEIIRMKIIEIRWLRALSIYRFYKKYIKEKTIDVVQCINWVPCGFAAVWATPKNIPVAVACHGSEITQWQRNPLRRFIRNRVLNNADVLTANTRYLSGLISNLGIKTNTQVTHFGISADFKYQNSTLWYPGKFIILTVCDLKPRKGISLVIKALSFIVKKIPNLLYVIIGSGPEKTNLVKLAEDTCVLENIQFKENICKEETAGWFNRCDIFVMVSEKQKDEDVEGFGFVYLEAARAGKPVIAGRTGGVAEAVQNGINCCY
ncbi:MAG: glycosyltransferase family 4 protein, partial [bacterium]